VGSEGIWQQYADEMTVPCNNVFCSIAGTPQGRDNRTPDMTYANAANYGVVYTDRLVFTNNGPTKKRQFTYSFINPNTEGMNASAGNHRKIGVKIHLYAPKGYDAQGQVSYEMFTGAREITVNQYSKPQVVLTVCCNPGFTGYASVEYVLGAGSTFGLLHNVQLRTALKCENVIVDRLPVED
jgi:hypothetical protein